MTQKDKDLLLKVLCEQLPYGVKVRVTDTLNEVEYDSVVYSIHANSASAQTYDAEHELVGWPSLMYESFKPYLRLMSSMTEKEKEEYDKTFDWDYSIQGTPFDWLNAHHFDYRGLIEKGLALEAPEGMYKTE